MTWDSRPGVNTRAWRRTRDEVLERDGRRCQLLYRGLCLGEATEVHHLVGIAERGIERRDAIDPDECVAVCTECHKVATARQAIAARARRAGRRRPRPHPADIP